MFTKTCWIPLALVLYMSDAITADSSRGLQSAPAPTPKALKWATSAIMRDKNGTIIGDHVISGSDKLTSGISATPSGSASAPTPGAKTTSGEFPVGHKPVNATQGMSTIVRYPNGTVGYEVSYVRE